MSSSVLDRLPATASTTATASARQRGDSPLVRVEGLRLATAGGRTEIVHGIDLEVHRGETVGIVGESGSGKTLACRSLLGILPHGVTRTGGILIKSCSAKPGL